jgi:hypothetical protein
LRPILFSWKTDSIRLLSSTSLFILILMYDEYFNPA